VLEAAPVPTRVLTGKLATDEEGAVIPVALPDHVEARYRPKADLHERLYLWQGGGLSLGGSMTTFGQSPVRITRLGTADAELHRQIFEARWASELYRDVPRSSEN
jgi:hypothetical protein